MSIWNKLFGSPEKRRLTQLNEQITELHQQGHYGQARELALQVYELTRQSVGENHPDFATSIANLGAQEQALGNSDEAKMLYEQVLRIRRATLGHDHSDVLEIISILTKMELEKPARTVSTQPSQQPQVDQQLSYFSQQVDQLCTQGHYDQALMVAKQACQFADFHYPNEKPPIVAACLNNLAAVYADLGNYTAAEPLYRQALDLQRQSSGEEHPDVAIKLCNLAELYRLMGNYTAAEPLFQQALEIWRPTLGEQHPYVAAALNNLAELYRLMGNYTAAEPLFQQALEIWRPTLGEQHPYVAAALNNLALLYRDVGNYPAAKQLFQQSLDLRRQALGEHHPDVATSLDNFASLFYVIGDYATAEQLFQQSLDLRRQALGEHHPDVANSLNNLATLYMTKGNYAAAESFYGQAFDLQRRMLGGQHPDMAASLNNLAEFYLRKGNYTVAEALCQQALALRRQVLGEQHPEVATSLNNLATVYVATGNYTAAEPLYHQVQTMSQEVLGQGHPLHALCLHNLMTLYVAQGRVSEALRLAEQVMSIQNEMLEQIFSIASERQRIAYVQTIWRFLYGFLSLAYHYCENYPDTVGIAYNIVLQRKAIVVEALAAQRDAILGGRYPVLASVFRDLTNMRRQIAQKMLAGPGPEGAKVHRQLLVQWQARREQLEASLAHQMPELSMEQTFQTASYQAVAHALPRGTVLIEFMRFNVYNFGAVPARGELPWKPARYLAFILHAAEPNDLRMVDLGEAAPIDQMIATFRTAIDQEVERSDNRGLGTRPPDLMQASVAEAGTVLRATIFDPLVVALNGRTRLMLAPDGDLSRLPFEVLPLDNDYYLIDEYEISYLSVGRDVLRLGAATAKPAAESLVIADPDFDLTHQREQSTETTGGSGRHSRDLERGDTRFIRLPSTQVEGKRISALLGVRPWLADEALEGRLKARRSPRILHLATHGFFLENQPHDLNEDVRSLGALGQGTDNVGLQVGPEIENPLLRSGLALAGVNTWLRHAIPPPEAEDGLLTAEDISGLDLLDTEMVVLSACETGLGAIHTSEGVFGLRRAFVLAGAKTLVMSLWKVPDLATAVLMERFYDNLLQPFMTRDAALREAQVYLRDLRVGQIRGTWLSRQMIARLAEENPYLRHELEDLARKPDDHRPFVPPLYWGAFICQGEVAPLS